LKAYLLDYCSVLVDTEMDERTFREINVEIAQHIINNIDYSKYIQRITRED